MGHTQMLLAVAGLKDDEVMKRMKTLGSGDWSSFPAYERQAYRFANKLSKNPALINVHDVRSLANTFGPERATDLIWYTSWCNYMTRVADAFQFNLERDNVFAQPTAKDKLDTKKENRPKPKDD
jgi:hypothetical protein